jgi:D-inositol-3-phosphate glycosyltransferase
MKIAMISEHASPLACLGGIDAGGQNVHVAALATALAERGHQVVVYTRKDEASLPDRVALAPGVAVEHIAAGPQRRVARDEIFPYMDAFAVQLNRRWRLAPPEVVHAHFWMSGLAALNASLPLGIPVVQTFHALGTVKRRWQAEADTSPSERICVERRLARLVACVIATCSDEVSELSTMGADRRSIDIIPCGVDLSLFTPAGPSEPARRRNRILTLSRMVPRKGIDDVIRSLAQLPDTELLIVGGPDAADLDTDAEARRLRALAVECQVAERVLLTGRMPHAALPALIRSADVVATVPWYEPFGIVPLEAMACAVPVVASAVGGQLDTIVHDQTGLLVPPRDPDRLAAVLAELLADPERRRRMGQAGRRRVEDRYSWPLIAHATERSYARVLASGLSPLSSVEASQ